MLAGVTKKIGDTDYVIPPLNLRAMRELLPQLKGMGTTEATPEDLAVIAKVVHAALVRNYPDMTVERVEDMLDITNVQEVMTAVLGASGLSPKTQAMIARADSLLNGARSTGQSSPLPDGPTTT